MGASPTVATMKQKEWDAFCGVVGEIVKTQKECKQFLLLTNEEKILFHRWYGFPTHRSQLINVCKVCDNGKTGVEYVANTYCPADEDVRSIADAIHSLYNRRGKKSIRFWRNKVLVHDSFDSIPAPTLAEIDAIVDLIVEFAELVSNKMGCSICFFSAPDLIPNMLRAAKSAEHLDFLTKHVLMGGTIGVTNITEEPKLLAR